MNAIIESATLVPHGGIPEPIAAAIHEVASQVKSLARTERNDHGHYNFASIDAFLSAVGPLCAGAGLLIVQDEDSIDVLERAGKGWVKATYTFTLGHKTGVMWDRPIRRTVLQAISGPQTTGGTQSYALKQFMRSLFQIPTGEKDDSDYQPNAPMPPPDPTRLLIRRAEDGPDLRGWTLEALNILADAPNADWRQQWGQIHEDELEEVGAVKPNYAAKIRKMIENGLTT
jgi:hypothetical protein